MPLMMTGFCLLYNVTGPARGVAVVAGAVPTATNAYILARQLGGDAPLMANVITFTTLAGLRHHADNGLSVRLTACPIRPPSL